MNSANSVRVTKIKVHKDKLGQKWSTIQLTRAIDESDRYTPAITAALTYMTENKEAAQVKLSTEVEHRNMTFFPGAIADRPSEFFSSIELGNFKLRREESADRDWIVLTFDFTVPLESARRWLIPSIGDDILLIVEDAQLSFPKE